MKCKFEQKFNSETMLQNINDMPSVIHCHHYTALFTKGAIDMDHIQGSQILADSMEESFYIVFKRYMIKEGIVSQQDKVDIIKQYFSLSGLGKIELKLNSSGGEAILEYSHLDEGWLKKFKEDSEFPINFITCGFIAAAFSIINNKKLRTYGVIEVVSMAMGATKSRFEIKER